MRLSPLWLSILPSRVSFLSLINAVLMFVFEWSLFRVLKDSVHTDSHLVLSNLVVSLSTSTRDSISFKSQHSLWLAAVCIVLVHSEDLITRVVQRVTVLFLSECPCAGSTSGHGSSVWTSFLQLAPQAVDSSSHWLGIRTSCVRGQAVVMWCWICHPSVSSKEPAMWGFQNSLRKRTHNWHCWDTTVLSSHNFYALSDTYSHCIFFFKISASVTLGWRQGQMFKNECGIRGRERKSLWWG